MKDGDLGQDVPNFWIADKPQTGLICGYKGVLSVPDECGVVHERIGLKSSIPPPRILQIMS